MVLLDSQKYKPVRRDRLFFDQYHYCMSFRFAESGRMRSLQPRDIKQSVHYANTMMRHSINTRTRISQEHEGLMLELATLINTISVPFKRVVYSDWQYFYTNDVEFFDWLARFPQVKYVNYTRAEIAIPRDTVVLKASDYQWRSYFRDRFYKQDQLEILSRFLLNRPEQFAITRHWQDRLRNKNLWISRSFFVDHHDQRDVLLLNMALPGAIRKTMPILLKQ